LFGQDTIKNGTYTFKSKYGSKFIMSYKNDTLNGPYFMYNDNNELRLVGDFAKGYRNGTQKMYENGLLRVEKKFIKGKIESINVYLPNGDIASQAFYNDSVLIMETELYEGTLYPNPQKDSKNKVYKEGFIKSYMEIKNW
jgi:antitoxin component YwqK of YwqJK toxin-antitoxin module